MNSMNTATRKQRIRLEKTAIGARSDLWELQYLCHSRRGPRYLKRVRARTERRLSRLAITEGILDS